MAVLELRDVLVLWSGSHVVLEVSQRRHLLSHGGVQRANQADRELLLDDVRFFLLFLLFLIFFLAALFSQGARRLVSLVRPSALQRFLHHLQANLIPPPLVFLRGGSQDNLQGVVFSSGYLVPLDENVVSPRQAPPETRALKFPC